MFIEVSGTSSDDGSERRVRRGSLGEVKIEFVGAAKPRKDWESSSDLNDTATNFVRIPEDAV
jgi:hypothetical protein